MLMPVCAPGLGNPYDRTGGSKYNSFNVGAGDTNTGFGLGLTNYWVFQWTYSQGGEISFKLPGKYFVSQCNVFE